MAYRIILYTFLMVFTVMIIRIFINRSTFTPVTVSMNSDISSFSLNDTPIRVSQEHVDLAMKAFSIKLPENTELPIYDPTLTDRGLTLPGNLFYKTRIFVGPEAFTSWGILGSTLAHEIEVHANQNVYLIVLKDLLGLQGTHEAEREAYLYEISHKDRFRLNIQEIADIESIMNYYYPHIPSAGISFSKK